MPQVTGCKLTPAQIRIIKALEYRPMVKKELEDAAGFTINTANLGYVGVKPLGSNGQVDDEDSLIGQGLVAAKIDPDEDAVVLSLTKEGVRAAKTYSTNAKIAKSDRIPSEILDPAVLRIKPLRAYAFEQYTPVDFQMVRAACGKAYGHVSDDSLQRQMQTRRKIGAYASPFSPKWPDWYLEYIQSSHFARVSRHAIETWQGCSLNQEHEVEDETQLEVVHRRFVNLEGESVIDCETPTDVIVLCPQCLKRAFLSLPPVPTQDLR